MCIKDLVWSARAVLHSSGTPSAIWPHAVWHVVDTRNVMSNRANKDHQSTLYVITGGRKANYADLVHIGTLFFKHVEKGLRIRGSLDWPGGPCGDWLQIKLSHELLQSIHLSPKG